MTIYFDNDKNAYGYEIAEYICTITDEQWREYAGTDKWDIIEGIFTDITDTPEYKEKKRKEERERINNLKMTALDFLNVLKSFGFTDAQVEAYLDANLNLKHQLQYCQNVYCGVAKALMPIEYEGITITADMVEAAFIHKGE